MTVILRNRVHVCGICGENRVTLLVLGNTPAIVNAVCVEAVRGASKVNTKVSTLT